ncbi:MAG: hypothetical protein M5R37_05790 [Melioribacteraceae bacterium]|jgi:hypothetical protein|nr:hypothetical protein [Melioribacteraceae bacterium]
MFTILKKPVLVLFISLSVIVFTSCGDDDPVTPQEEHFEAIGTVIYDATGAEVLRILRGVTSDTLFAKVGILSDHYNVKFLDEDEVVVTPPADDETTMGLDITDTNLLAFEQDEPGAFEFHLEGKAAGITTIEIKILHSGHSDYRSGLIPVKVEN